MFETLFVCLIFALFCQEAITTLDQKVLSKTKRLNALKHATQTCQQRLEELNTEEERRKHELMPLTCYHSATSIVGFLSATFHRPFSLLFSIAVNQDESLTYGDQINSLEAEILKYREELHNLQILYNEAQLSKKAAKVQRTIMQPDELSSEAQHSSTRMAAEEEKAISTFEEAFRRIKVATGVTDIQEVVEHFIFQTENHQHLEKLKQENEEVLLQLKEQKELLGKQFEDIKYSGEAKLSSEQQMLEECEHQLQLQQLRCVAAAERLGWQVKTLGTVRAGVEHLAGKLQHILLVNPSRPSPFYVDILSQCELKLQMLLKDLEGKDLASIAKEIEEYEVRYSLYDHVAGNLWHMENRFPSTEKTRVAVINPVPDKRLGGRSDNAMTEAL
uniref:Coiled-coil domain containing 151 n=1 Tax=Fundulus heteroclitus TaxID=8078 RepID=A0A3Q2Q4M2_FUNHE